MKSSPRSESPAPISASEEEEEEEAESDDMEETIGRSAGRTTVAARNGYTSDASGGGYGSGSGRARRPRPISYTPGMTTPLRLRVRSQSAASNGGGGGGGASTTDDEYSLPPSSSTSSLASGTSGKFVDPLVLRKQAREEKMKSLGTQAPKAAAGKRKVPVGELVAYFQAGERA
jgi:hypothetical protein